MTRDHDETEPSGPLTDADRPGENRFDPIDEVLIEAIAAGATYAEAGPLVGLSARSVRRRMTAEDFASAVETRRHERMSQITGALMDASQQAVQILLAGLEEEGVYQRMRAAQLVLSMSLRFRSVGKLEQRVAALERLIAEHEAEADQ